MKNIAICSYKFMDVVVTRKQGTTTVKLRTVFSTLQKTGFSKNKVEQATNEVFSKHAVFSGLFESIKKYFREVFVSIENCDGDSPNSNFSNISRNTKNNSANVGGIDLDASNGVNESSVEENTDREMFKQEMACFMLSVQLSQLELKDLIKGGHANLNREVSIYKSFDNSCEAFAVRSQSGRLEIRIRELETSGIVGDVPSPQSEILLSIESGKFDQFINICKNLANKCNEGRVSSVIKQNLSIVCSCIEHHDYLSAVSKCQTLASLYEQKQNYNASAEMSQLSGKMFTKLGKYELAAEQYQQSAKMFAKLDKYELAAEQHQQSAKMFLILGKHELAAEQYHNAAQSYLWSKTFDCYASCITMYCNMINVYMESEEYEKAGQIAIIISYKLKELNLFKESGVFFNKTIDMFNTAIEYLKNSNKDNLSNNKLKPQEDTDKLILRLSSIRNSLKNSPENAESKEELAVGYGNKFILYKEIIRKEGEQPNNPIGEQPASVLNLTGEATPAELNTQINSQTDSFDQSLYTEARTVDHVEHMTDNHGSLSNDVTLNSVSDSEDEAYTELVTNLINLCMNAESEAVKEGIPYSNDGAAFKLHEFICTNYSSDSTNIKPMFDVMFKLANNVDLRKLDPQNTLFNLGLVEILNRCRNIDVVFLNELYTEYCNLGDSIGSLNSGQIQILQVIAEVFVDNCDKWINDSTVRDKFLSFMEPYAKDGQCANKVRQFMKLHELSKSSLQSGVSIKDKSNVYSTPNEQQIARQSARKACLTLLGNIIENLKTAKNSGLQFFIYEDPAWKMPDYNAAVRAVGYGHKPDNFAIGRVYRLLDKSIVQVGKDKKLKLLIPAEKGLNIDKHMYTNEDFKKLATDFDEIDLSAQGEVYNKAIEVLESVKSILNYVGAWGGAAVTLTELGKIGARLPALLDLLNTMKGDVSVRYVLFNMLHVIAVLTSEESPFGITKLLSLDSRVICGGMGKPSLLIHPKFMEQINALDKLSQERQDITTKLLDLYMLPSDSYNSTKNDDGQACKEQIKSELNAIKISYRCLEGISDADINEFANTIYTSNKRVWDTLMLDCERINHWLPKISNPVAWNDFSELLSSNVNQVRSDGQLNTNVNRVKMS